jgi:hypothetical protein
MTTPSSAASLNRPQPTAGKTPSHSSRRTATVAVCLLLVGAVVALAVWAARTPSLIVDLDGRIPVWTFLALATTLLAFTLLLGWAITGALAGALIDPKKGRFSLSRLQMISWTVLILAAYLNAFIVNIAAGRANPIEVAIPGQLLAAMGISIGGLVGTQLILGYKQDKNGVIQSTDANTVLLDKDTPNAALVKASKTDVSDFFKGDTAQTSGSLDLGKIQLFFVTLVLVLGYAIALADLFAHLKTGSGGGVGSLPKIDQAFVGLLALSHGGYLTTKATS